VSGPSPCDSGGRYARWARTPDALPAESSSLVSTQRRTDPQPLTHAVARPSRTPVLRSGLAPNGLARGAGSSAAALSYVLTECGSRSCVSRQCNQACTYVAKPSGSPKVSIHPVTPPVEAALDGHPVPASTARRAPARRGCGPVPRRRSASPRARSISSRSASLDSSWPIPQLGKMTSSTWCSLTPRPRPSASAPLRSCAARTGRSYL
jgi:hypothetical protein